MSELIEWIYDNFNLFFNVDNNNKIQIYNSGNRQYYRCSNQLLGNCVRDNDILIISEIQQKKQLSLILEYAQDAYKIIFEDDITIQEMMEFTYLLFKISMNLKLDLICEHFNLSNYDIKKKLAEFNLQNDTKIKIKPVQLFDNSLINLTIICKDQGCSVILQFNKSDTLNTVLQSIQNYLGLNDQTVALSVIIKGKYYNEDGIRKKTLAQNKIEDNDIIEIKVHYCGGK